MIFALEGGAQDENLQGDKLALLAFKDDIGNQGARSRADSYNRGEPAFVGWGVGLPCATGWNSEYVGWEGVICDAPGGKVVYLWRDDEGLGGTIAHLGALKYVQSIDLHLNPALHGNIVSFGTLPELRLLWLTDTAVTGPVLSLARLTHLGEFYTVSLPEWAGSRGVLLLARTNVHGSVAPLRALPGLRVWGRRNDDFTACDTYDCGELRPVSTAAGIAGRDECSCCLDSPVKFDNATGVCGRDKQQRETDWAELRETDRADMTIVIVAAVSVAAIVACTLVKKGYNMHNSTIPTATSETDVSATNASRYLETERRHEAATPDAAAATMTSSAPTSPRMMKASFPWNETTGASPTDLHFSTGDVIEVLNDGPGQGWLTGRLANHPGMSGIFPENYAIVDTAKSNPPKANGREFPVPKKSSKSADWL